MLQTPTVFEAAIKTICTTNVAWRATVRVVNALVEQLGEAAPAGAHAFPMAEAMASVPETFYQETVRAGYRSAYLHALASGVVAGTFDVEALGAETDLPDEEVAARLLALPGRFRRYGRYSGLAFWLYLTKDWVPD